MRLLICAGGTGGGVYPALAVLQAIRNLAGLTTLWVGGIGGMEADLMQRANVPFEAIEAAGVHGVGLKALPGNSARLARGYFQSRAILRRFRPEVLFFTGGYLAVPMALAGRGIPKLLYVPDIEPGLALKTLARFANHIAVTAPASRAFFPRRGAVTVTGYPTRPDLQAWDLDQARQALGLQAGLPTLLVFGGSKGAHSINQALWAALPALLPEMQIVHVTGQLDWPAAQQVHPELAERYHAFPYLHAEMGAAFTAADLVVSRAGASSLGEFPLFGLPAVLVPYPHAWRYQQVNAQHLERQGAALLLPDVELPARLAATVRSLLQDQARLAAMRAAMQSLARPSAAAEIGALLTDLAAGRPVAPQAMKDTGHA